MFYYLVLKRVIDPHPRTVYFYRENTVGLDVWTDTRERATKFPEKVAKDRLDCLLKMYVHHNWTYEIVPCIESS